MSSNLNGKGTIMNEKTKTKIGIYVSFLLGIFLMLGLLIFLSSISAANEHESFAQCLSQKNITMYGAFWCPHCQEQKEYFGQSFKYVNYVECSEPDLKQNNLCNAEGIVGYPTWKFANETKYEGELTLENLSQISGCQLEAKLN